MIVLADKKGSVGVKTCAVSHQHARVCAHVFFLMSPILWALLPTACEGRPLSLVVFLCISTNFRSLDSGILRPSIQSQQYPIPVVRTQAPTFLPRFSSAGLNWSIVSRLRTATPSIFMSLAPCLSMSTFLNRGCGCIGICKSSGNEKWDQGSS